MSHSASRSNNRISTTIILLLHKLRAILRSKRTLTRVDFPLLLMIHLHTTPRIASETRIRTATMGIIVSNRYNTLSLVSEERAPPARLRQNKPLNCPQAKLNHSPRAASGKQPTPRTAVIPPRIYQLPASSSRANPTKCISSKRKVKLEVSMGSIIMDIRTTLARTIQLI